MKNKKDIPEVSSLRWLANMFPFTENAKDDTDKMSNAIHVYCTAGANKIEELSYRKYNVITLCGSTKFKDEFIRMQKELTLKGNIVIGLSLFGHSGDDEALNLNTIMMLGSMHKQKIDMADEIFVINPGGYIGEGTKSEIAYAISKGKKVSYLEDIND